MLAAPGQRHDPRHGERGEQQVVQGGGEEEPAEADVAGGGVTDEGADARVEQGGADGGADHDDQRAGGRAELAALGLGQSGEVADDAEDQGVPAHRVVGRRCEVGEESGAEAHQAAAGGPVDHGQGEDGEQQQVGDGAGQLEPGEDADLDDEGDDDQRGGEQNPVEAHGSSSTPGRFRARAAPPRGRRPLRPRPRGSRRAEGR